MAKEPPAHKLRHRLLNLPGRGRTTCGLIRDMKHCRKTWTAIRCGNCLRSKPKGKP